MGTVCRAAAAWAVWGRWRARPCGRHGWARSRALMAPVGCVRSCVHAWAYALGQPKGASELRSPGGSLLRDRTGSARTVRDRHAAARCNISAPRCNVVQHLVATQRNVSRDGQDKKVRVIDIRTGNVALAADAHQVLDSHAQSHSSEVFRRPAACQPRASRASQEQPLESTLRPSARASLGGRAVCI